MTTEENHEWYCFAEQPAPCRGYFPEDVLPCVCGARENVIATITQIVERPLPAYEGRPVLVSAA